jgi:DnaJ homolog subfamily A member 5
MFVRKRDPRYKAFLAHQAQSPGPRATPTPVPGAVAPQKVAPISTFVAQDWQKVAEPSDAAADLEWARTEGAEDEEWECIACNKTFRSEAAWDSHERSKKHFRAVEQLKREMQNEELDLELELCQDDGAYADAGVRDHEKEGDQGTAPGADALVDGYTDKEPPEATPDREASAPMPKAEDNTTEGEEFAARPGRQKRTKKKVTPSPSPSLTPPILPKTRQEGRSCAARRSSSPSPPLQQRISDLVFPEENLEALTLESRFHHDGNDGDIVREEDGASAATSTKGEMSKREKRRAREAAKKAREAEAKSGCAVSFFLLITQIPFNSCALCLFLYPCHWAEKPPLSFRLAHPFWSFFVTNKLITFGQCNVCGEIFENRTKLFEHINREGHALADPRDGDTSKKRGKKTKR